ncbi:YrhK family protein [Stakelama tenebrarum]|nr:YrhK family protein [Sphingosinithalassobacter tenebrarum]
MLQTLTREYPYIHITSGLLGNAMFFAGSILFFKQFEEYKTIGVWLFVIGSALMLLGAVGNGIKTLYETREKKRRKAGR